MAHYKFKQMFQSNIEKACKFIFILQQTIGMVYLSISYILPRNAISVFFFFFLYRCNISIVFLYCKIRKFVPRIKLLRLFIRKCFSREFSVVFSTVIECKELEKHVEIRICF